MMEEEGGEKERREGKLKINKDHPIDDQRDIDIMTEWTVDEEEGRWSVILRRKESQQVVLYNEAEKRVIVREENSLENQQVGQSVNGRLVCSLCQRPFITTPGGVYMDENYFRLLDVSSRQHSSYEQFSELREIRNIPLNTFNQGYYARFFREGRRLGRGARGSVHLAQHVLEAQSLGEYAVKKVPVGDDSVWLSKMLHEVHIMESLRHPNIISYKHAWLEIHRPSPFGPAVPCLFILMEYANGGNLEDYVLAELVDESTGKGKGLTGAAAFLPLEEILALSIGICRGLVHLHQCGIIHRDLKPSNILLNYAPSMITQPDILISDFGECNRAKFVDQSVRTGATGTIEFCAPELFQVEQKTGHFIFTQSTITDMWSFGMILYYMCFGGRLPYENIENVDILRQDMLQLRKVNLPRSRADLPTELLQLMQELLCVDPLRRPSASQTLQRLLSTSPHRRPALVPKLGLPGSTLPVLRGTAYLLPYWIPLGLLIGSLTFSLLRCHPRSISILSLSIQIGMIVCMVIFPRTFQRPPLLLLGILVVALMVGWEEHACA